jgi:hypothetical protein
MPYDEHIEDALNVKGDAKTIVAKEAAVSNEHERREGIFVAERKRAASANIRTEGRKAYTEM